MFTASLFTRAKRWKIQISIDSCMDKQKVVSTNNGILFGLNNDILTRYNREKPDDIMLREMTQTQKDKNCMSPLI